MSAAEATALALLGPMYAALVVFLLVRVGSAAYFNSKRDHERLMKGTP